jgi:PGAP1-like protein
MKNQVITIFIHGTLLPTAILKLPLIHEFFFCPEGLTHAKELGKKYHLAQLARLLYAQDPKRFPLKKFYLFGWSGQLSFRARKKAAYNLYYAIEAILQFYGRKTAIRLITHSHGGNIALQLESIANEQGNIPFSISELILLACPVQTSTAPLICDKRFKQVYSIHSHRDLAQVIDPQGFYYFLQAWKDKGLGLTLAHLERLGPLFSERHFTHSHNLLQVQVKFNGHNLLHIEFLLLKFISLLPSVLDILKNLQQLPREQDDIIVTL